MTLYALGVIALMSLIRAQEQASWPMWVTNDYNCVIGCMQQHFTDTQPPATTDQYNGAMGCVRSTCAKETEDANIYQAQYIINMYNQIGSIYEPEDWQNGNIPTNDGQPLTAPDGWVQTTVTTSHSNTEGWQTRTDTVWAPPPPPSTSDAPVETETGTGGGEASVAPTTHSSSAPKSSDAAPSGSTSGGAARAVAIGRGMGGMVVALVGVVFGAAVVGL